MKMKIKHLLTLLFLQLLYINVSLAQTWTVYNSSNSSLPDNFINSISLGWPDNNLKWIGTNNGLVNFDGASWNIFNTSNSALPSNQVYSTKVIYGRVWFGTGGGGIGTYQTWDSTIVVSNTSNSNLTTDIIRTIDQDGYGNIWASMATGCLDSEKGGLAKKSGNNWDIHNTTTEGPSNMYDCYVWTIDANYNGSNVWVGFLGFGVSNYESTTGTWTNYNQYTSNPLPNQFVMAIKIDPQTKGVWVGSQGGLSYFDGTNWTTFTTSNSGLPNNYIMSIEIDTYGNKWIGTDGGGLAKFDGTNWTIYNSSNSSIPNNRVSSLVFDDINNTIWVGTAGAGLASLSLAPCTKPIANFTSSQNTICKNNTVVFTNTSSGAYSYLWKVNGIETSTNINYTKTFNSIGTYTISLIANNGPCADTTSNTYQVFDLPIISNNLNFDTTICNGDSVFLDAGVGFSSYLWNTNESTQNVTISDSGQYYVIVTNANGCSINSDTVHINMFPLPNIPIITQVSNVLISTPSSSYQWYLNNKPISSDTNQYYIPTQKGAYSVGTSDVNNCIAKSSDFDYLLLSINDTCFFTVTDTNFISVTDTLIINSDLTGVNPPNNVNTIKIYPNPANSHITIDYVNFNAMNGYTIKIVNSNGQTVFTTPINQQTSYIALSNWTGRGIYFVQLIDPQNNTIENRKIVIQ
jgi:hypothetical protein